MRIAPLLALAFGAQIAAAQDCVDDRCAFDACHTPAFAAPPGLELRPTGSGQLASKRDNTGHDQLDFFGCEAHQDHPYFEALDIENDWLFMVTNRGFQIWDIRPPKTSEQPIRRAYACANFPSEHPIPRFPTSNENAKFTMMDVDAPPNRDDVVVTVLRNRGGVVIWNTASKGFPAVLYQDHGSDVTQVYATTLRGRHYAFAADEDRGLHLYDLSSAQGLSLTPCVEESAAALSPSCSGVFRGRLGDFKGTAFVDGWTSAETDEAWVAFSGLSSSGRAGLEVWDVSNPLAPERKLSDDSQPFFGIALWKDASDGRVYLAARTRTDSRIYRDTGCLDTGACSLDALDLVWSAPIKAGLRKYVTYSESNATPFLYFGSSEQCASGADPERLFEITDPAQPREVGAAYWSFYYRTNPTPLSAGGRAGFNWVGPRMGKFNGRYFYRAGFGIFDIHEWTASGFVEGLFRDGFETGNRSRWSAGD